MNKSSRSSAKLVTELVEVSYWACDIPGHHHTTKEIAEKCIAKNRRPVRRTHWTNEKIAAVAESVIKGETLRAVGEKHGRSVERMRQVFNKALRKMTTPNMLEGERVPENISREIKDVRSESDFWLRQVSKLKEI